MKRSRKTKIGKVRREPALARGARPKCSVPAGRTANRSPKRIPPGLLKLRTALLSLAGLAKGLPRDFARNHDHYLHGTPKR